MAEHAHTISTSTPSPSRRSAIRGGLVAFAAAASAVGVTAGFAASVADFVPSDPDADLLALHPRLDIAVRDVGYSETNNGPPGPTDDEHNEWVSQTGQELEDACWAIVSAPAAQTAEGRALKAAAAMHQLRAAHCHGWPGAGEAQAWDVLSEIAGGVYVPAELPEWLRRLEPARAAV